jgi:hypothetical protein
MSGFIIDSFHDASGTDGRHHWDFSKEFGPLFTDARGRVLERQPKPGSAAWTAFERWHAELKAEKRALQPE